MGNAIARFFKCSIAVENGFLAAGATISLVAFVHSIVVVFSWLY